MKTNTVTWSGEQLAIFEWFQEGTGNLVVAARAGTGKTTTIKVAMTYAPEEKILYAVFGKRNQVEAQAAITDPRVEIKTLHSLGYAFIRQVWRGVRPDDSIERTRIEQSDRNIPIPAAAAVEKLVGFAKNTTTTLPTVAELVAIADSRQVECPEYEAVEDGGYTVEKLATIAQAAMKLAMDKNPQGLISFNDMVWLPVAMKWVRPWFNLVVIDEAQDMNAPQLAMARLACKRGGRVCVVGDDRQAIFGFRGAVQDGLAMMERELSAKHLTLTVTYRCPRKVVEIASGLVPDYKAAASAPEGIVETAYEDTFADRLEVGDAVLSRVNAPLMPLCLQLLRKGTPARIEGRDIGKALAGIVRKMKARSVPDFIKKINAWGDKMMKRAANGKHAESKIDLINDQVETLVAVAEGAASVTEIENRITSLFQDSTDNEGRPNPKPAVVFSSTHKAKGLEWSKVYVLSKTYRVRAGTAVSEEANLWYVAVTRAKAHLVIVEQKK